MANDNSNLRNHKVVSREEWLAARTAFLIKEKEFTKQRDALSQARRELPWAKVDKTYVFDGPNGKETLSDLFESRSQLVVYHFMFNPNWEAGCKHCSFWADNFNDIIVHLNHRDVTMLAISRAPLSKLDAFKQRMGWTFKWVSSEDSDFNYDYNVSFTPEQTQGGEVLYNYAKSKMDAADREGVSVFYKDETGAIFHTYSSFARGIDLVNTAYNYLDLVPKGRDEGGKGPGWVRHTSNATTVPPIVTRPTLAARHTVHSVPTAATVWSTAILAIRRFAMMELMMVYTARVASVALCRPAAETALFSQTGAKNASPRATRPVPQIVDWPATAATAKCRPILERYVTMVPLEIRVTTAAAILTAFRRLTAVMGSPMVPNNVIWGST